MGAFDAGEEIVVKTVKFGFARDAGASAVLSNVVRYADRGDAPTADVLDASRRLVALDRYERYARTKRRRASDRFDVGIGTLGGDVGAVEQLM